LDKIFSSIKIIVDNREQNQCLIEALRNELDISIQFERLEVGDFLLPNLLVERKSLIDFCDSIKDGRLFRQATLLARSAIQPVVIIEGTSSDLRKKSIKREVIQGALITLSLIYRIPILRSKSPEETGKLILFASKQIENLGLSDHRFRRFSASKNSLREKLRMQMHILQGFPGIGPGSARKLIEKFGTIKNVLQASENQLSQVSGIPKKTINRILELSN